MKKRTFSAITIAALISSGIAFAENPTTAAVEQQKPAHGKQGAHQHGKHHQGLPRGFERLNLSDKQKAEIQKIMQANRPTQPKDHAEQRAQFQQKMQQRQAREQQLLNNKTFDEQAARQLIAERQQERAEMERNHAERELQELKTRHAVFQVLTPAQQKQWLDNKTQHKPAKQADKTTTKP